MTCIVGVIDRKEGRVYMGADSAGVDCGTLQIVSRKDVKVFRVGEFVIGCTTSFRMIQLLRYSLKLPKVGSSTDIYRYMCTDFINAVRSCFKEGGFLEKEKEREGGGTFLVGYQSRLFQIMDDYQVQETLEDFDACGCGARYAMGALMATGEEWTAQDRIKRALQVAEHFSAGVRPPFIIETT
jgi:ATP-dependent protease HslVU (ClpYQ) peptidase subunit